MQGKFIVIEGIDGAGGETQSKLLLKHFKNKKMPAVRVAYPDYSGPIGKLIYEFLHKKFNLSTEMQFLLYAADMVKDSEKIERHLKAGKTVIADRWFTSTILYQGMQGFPEKYALAFAEQFGIRRPDVVLYLRIRPGVSIKRKFREKNSLDRNEANKKFLENVSRFYDNAAKRNVFGKWVKINGEKPIEEVFAQVKRALRV